MLVSRTTRALPGSKYTYAVKKVGILCVLFVGLHPTAVEIVGSRQFFQSFWLFDGIHGSVFLVIGHFL